MIVSVIGKSGTGKSTLINELLSKSSLMSRVSGDEYAIPIEENQSIREYFSEPRIDWLLINRHLSNPIDSIILTPVFDYTKFQRISEDGGKEYEIKQIMLIDQVFPHPDADFVICCELPEVTRRVRSIIRNIEKRRGIQLLNKFRAKNNLSPFILPNLEVDLYVNSTKSREFNAQIALEAVLLKYNSLH